MNKIQAGTFHDGDLQRRAEGAVQYFCFKCCAGSWWPRWHCYRSFELTPWNFIWFGNGREPPKNETTATSIHRSYKKRPLDAIIWLSKYCMKIKRSFSRTFLCLTDFFHFAWKSDFRRWLSIVKSAKQTIIKSLNEKFSPRSHVHHLKCWFVSSFNGLVESQVLKTEVRRPLWFSQSYSRAKVIII